MITNTPQLRFSEFTDEWQEKKLGDLCKINQGLQIAISQRHTKKIPNSYFYITNEFLKSGSKKQYYIVNPPKSVICNESDLLMTRTGNTGQVVTGVDGAFHNNFFKIACNNKLFQKFIYYFLTSKKIKNLILRLAGTSTIPDLNHGDFYSIKINIPTVKEQQKIADFLGRVDEKIDKLERKHELFSEYKKGIIQKIFSQEIRFKDENGKQYPDWEEKKLREICKIKTGKLDANAMVKNGKYRFYTCAKEHFQIDNYAFDTEALLVSGNGANVGYIHYYKGKFNAYQRTYVLDKFNKSIIFTKYFLDKYLTGRINLEKKEGNTPYIVLGTLANMKINIPVLDEQQKITDFLTLLDNKIDQINNSLTQAKLFKKSLLQKMFV